jgi:hypothetical protein
MSGQQRGTIECDGTTFYFSYSTIVGFRRDGQRAHFNGKRYSATTTRHIQRFGQELGYEYDTMTPEDFARSLRAFPSLPAASFSKFGKASDDRFVRTGYTDERSILMGRAPRH